MGDELGKMARSVDVLRQAAIEAEQLKRSEAEEAVRHVAAGTQLVSGNIEGVTQAAAETGTASGRVLASAHDLADEVGELKAVVSNFLSGVKTA